MPTLIFALLLAAGLDGAPPAAGSTLGELPRPRAATTTAPNLAGRTVVLSVDDGYHSVFTNVYPLLKRHRMSMTLGVICDYVRGGTASYQPSGGFMKRSEIQEMVDSCGIEIASHSLSHPFLTRLDSATAWNEITRSKAVLESLFGHEVMTFVYPYGDLNARVIRMVQAAGYRMGRAVRPGTPNLWVEPWRLPIVELRQETKLEDIKAAVARRPITILLLHQVVAKPTVFTQWSADSFALLLDWLDEGGARVVTLRQLYREWWYEKMGRMMEQVAAAFPDRRKELLFQDVDVDATKAPHPR